MDSKNKVAELVRKNEEDFVRGETSLSKYVDFSLNENIEKIDAYLNSKHTSGETDAMGRDKPFFNIVTSAVNIWYRATDLDRKDIKIKATKSREIMTSFIATVHLQNWMRKDNFGAFLNEWGRTLARYGSAVVKFVENGEGLHAMVVPWNRLIVDAVDFDNDVTIEVLEMTPAQLSKKKGYDQEIVKKLIDATTTRKTTDGHQKDNKDNFIKVYEVHGDMPLSYLTGKDKDEDEYVQQMHVISFVAGKEKGDFDDFTLISGKETNHPYMITHLIKEDGRSMSIGAVEHLFEAQWMMNHSVKSIKDQLDLASKLIFQTSDGNFVGQNALSSIENGDILIHATNQPLTQLANNSNDIASLQNFQSQWKSLGNEITGISESMMGTAAPSGTAWRQVEALLQENHSLFEIMTENKGLHVEEMMRKYILPYLKKKMNTADEISATLDAQGIEKVDKKYVPIEATKRLAQKIANHILTTGEVPTIGAEDEQIEIDGVKIELDEQGNQRFFVPDELSDLTWKEFFKDMEWELEVDITGEQKDKQNNMATLVTVLQAIGGNPALLQDENARMILNKILEMTNAVSPAELASIKATPPQALPMQPSPAAPPVGQPIVGGGFTG